MSDSHECIEDAIGALNAAICQTHKQYGNALEADNKHMKEFQQIQARELILQEYFLGMKSEKLQQEEEDLQEERAAFKAEKLQLRQEL